MLSLERVKAFSTTYKCLNNLVLRHFSVYNNESLKQNFEEKLKEKYFVRNQQSDDMNARAKMDLYSEMKEAHQNFYETLRKEESILKAYKKQVKLDTADIQDQMERSENARFVVATHQHFAGAKDTEQFMDRSKKLIESYRTSSSWSPVQKERISDKYLEYGKYEKNNVTMKDSVRPPSEASGDFSLGQNLLKFVKNLDGNMAEKKYVEEVEQRQAKKMEDPGVLQKRLEAFWLQRGFNSSKFSRQTRKLLLGNKVNTGAFSSRNEHPRPIWGRVSPWAREEIYKLHLEGWSIRDLSVRYGLLPERLKFIIWSRQYFYDEILPNVDLDVIELALEREMMYSVFFPWVDYGKDLHILAEKDRGILFERYRFTELDVKPPAHIKAKLDKLYEESSKKRYEIVTENFVGHGPKGYYVKSWIVARGHGSERVNKKFKMAVQHTQKPQLMPDRVRNKLSQGPRIAAQGWGIK